MGSDVDEAAVVQLRHNDGALSSLTLSLAQQPPSRTIAIDFENGGLHGDLQHGTLRVWSGVGEETSRSFDSVSSLETSYLAQMQSFIEATEGKPSAVVRLAEAADILDATLGPPKEDQEQT